LVVAVSRGILEIHAKEVQSGTNTKLWTHERCLPIRCDVRLKAQVEIAVQRCIERFGQLDIVVKFSLVFWRVINCSCAGWGILGACEEQTDFELRSQFETNVYGTFNVIRQTLPILRERPSARYINLSSTSLFLSELN
jgi:NAD(P)-dependent dehydrogenase (short-subunit alcohol dehydrogenase family)